MTDSVTQLLIAGLVGTASGADASIWGMYKDAPHEGFAWPRFLRSILIGAAAAVALQRLLRLDLPRLAILKTYPLSGAKLVAAEIAGTTVLHSISIWAVMIVPVMMLLFNPSMFESVERITIFLLSAAVAVPAVNSLTFTIQNGAALMFPSWVRMGVDSRGFETMGQNLLTMGATTLLSAVALVFPVGLGVLIAWLGATWLGSWSVFAAAVAGSTLLFAELWPVIFWLGSVFDLTDVSEVAPSQ